MCWYRKTDFKSFLQLRRSSSWTQKLDEDVSHVMLLLFTVSCSRQEQKSDFTLESAWMTVFHSRRTSSSVSHVSLLHDIAAIEQISESINILINLSISRSNAWKAIEIFHFIYILRYRLLAGTNTMWNWRTQELARLFSPMRKTFERFHSFVFSHKNTIWIESKVFLNFRHIWAYLSGSLSVGGGGGSGRKSLCGNGEVSRENQLVLRI